MMSTFTQKDRREPGWGGVSRMTPNLRARCRQWWEGVEKSKNFRMSYMESPEEASDGRKCTPSIPPAPLAGHANLRVQQAADQPTLT